MKNISSPAIFLSLFLLASFLSLDRVVGPAFEGLPQKLTIITIISYVISSFLKGDMILFRLNWPSFFLIVIAIISTWYTFVLSVDQNHSFEIWSRFIKCIGLYFLIANILKTKNDFLLFIFSMSVCAIYIAYDFIHNPSWHAGRAYYYNSNLVGDPNGLAMLFTFSLPIIAALFFVIKSRIFRGFLLLGGFYCILGIFETQSRGGFLGLITVMIMTIGQMMQKKSIWTVLLFLLISSVIMVRYMPRSYFYRVTEIGSIEADDTGSSKARLSAMTLASAYIITHPFSEYGLGNHPYYIAGKYGLTTAKGSVRFGGGNLAHNIFLQYGADTGFIPMVIYIMFILAVYIKLGIFRKITNEKPAFKDYIFCIDCIKISLSGFLVGAFFLPWAYRIHLFIITGIAVGLCEVIKNEVTVK